MRSTVISCAAAVLALSLSGCYTTHSSSTYSRQQMGRAATVTHGVIVSMREVDIKGTESGIGATSGAAAGAIGGSYAGGTGRTTALGVIGGAVAGGVVGALAEGEVTKTKATEFLIKEENGDLIAIVQLNDQDLKPNEKILIMRMDKIRIVRDTTESAPPTQN